MARLCHALAADRGAVMPDYRVYLLNAQDRIEEALLVTCDDNEQAIAEMVLNAEAANGAELWQLGRLVHRVKPVPKSPKT